MQVPAIGQTLSREFMPQIKNIPDFLDELELNGISHRLETLNPFSLRSTQSEFDANKVFQMMQSHGERTPIIVSKDGYVLDGHHRWLEAHNKCENVDAHVCDASILDLLHHAKRFCCDQKALQEGIEHTEFGPMLDSFVKFASDKLGIKSLPNIRFKDEGDSFNSFAAYFPGKKHTAVSIKNRHPMDVFRSVAHELVHHKQDEDGRLYDGAGETGSPIEDEANAMAGRIMRHWAKENPHHFHMTHIAEAIFVVGGPCSGKDRIVKQLSEIYKAGEMDLPGKILEVVGDTNTIINVSPDQIEDIAHAKQMFEEAGFDTSLYFVDTTNEISKLRNEARASKGQRVIAEGVRFEKFRNAQASKEYFVEMFGRDMHIIDNSIQEGKNDVTVKVKVEQPKASAKPKAKTATTPSKPAAKKSSTATKPAAAPAKPKPKKKVVPKTDPHKLKADMENRTKVADHYTNRAQEFQVRIDAVRNAMARLQPVGTNYHKVHKQLRQQLSGAILGMRKWQKQALNQHLPPKPATPNLNEAFESMMEHAGEWGTDELRSNYQKDTPGQPVGFQEPFSNYLAKNIEDYLAKKKADDSKPDEPNIEQMPPDGMGQTVATNMTAWPQARAGIGGIAEHIKEWAHNQNTVERYKARYPKNWESKILETARFLNSQDINSKPKFIRDIQEAIDKGVGDMGTVPNQNKEDQPVEECGPINKRKIIKRKQQ